MRAVRLANPKVSLFQIDFPSGNAVELLEGEEVQISNGYVQGAGSTAMVDRRAHDSSLGVGLLIGERFNSETMIVNTRIFGHALSGVEIAGGATFSAWLDFTASSPTYESVRWCDGMCWGDGDPVEREPPGWARMSAFCDARHYTGTKF